MLVFVRGLRGLEPRSARLAGSPSPSPVGFASGAASNKRASARSHSLYRTLGPILILKRAYGAFIFNIHGLYIYTYIYTYIKLGL